MPSLAALVPYPNADVDDTLRWPIDDAVSRRAYHEQCERDGIVTERDENGHHKVGQ